MINISLRDRNLLVTLSAPAKTPIKSRNGSTYFYNSMELLCIALGSCVGGELVKWCMHEKINPEGFESLQITMNDFIPKIIIQHPTTLSKEQLSDLEYLVKNCRVSQMLNKKPDLELIQNETTVEILIDQTRKGGCCGG